MEISNELLTNANSFFKQKELKLANECGDKAIYSLGALIEKVMCPRVLLSCPQLPNHQKVRSLFVTASDLVTSIKLAYADDTSAARYVFL